RCEGEALFDVCGYRVQLAGAEPGDYRRVRLCIMFDKTPRRPHFFAGKISSVCSSNIGSSWPARTNRTFRAPLFGWTSQYWMLSTTSPQSPQGGSGTSFGSFFAA